MRLFCPIFASGAFVYAATVGHHVPADLIDGGGSGSGGSASLGNCYSALVELSQIVDRPDEDMPTPLDVDRLENLSESDLIACDRDHQSREEILLYLGTKFFSNMNLNEYKRRLVSGVWNSAYTLNREILNGIGILLDEDISDTERMNEVKYLIEYIVPLAEAEKLAIDTLIGGGHACRPINHCHSEPCIIIRACPRCSNCLENDYRRFSDILTEIRQWSGIESFGNLPLPIHDISEEQQQSVYQMYLSLFLTLSLQSGCVGHACRLNIIESLGYHGDEIEDANETYANVFEFVDKARQWPYEAIEFLACHSCLSRTIDRNTAWEKCSRVLQSGRFAVIAGNKEFVPLAQAINNSLRPM